MIVYGNVPRPPMQVRIVPKSYDGAGYDSCPPRKIVGMCGHITDGLPEGNDAYQIDWYYDFLAPGGERHDTALFDFLIATGGTIVMYNDPWGRRRPWANGWGSEGPGLEGDGPAFIKQFGAYGTNYNLASCERVGTSPNAMTGPQMLSSAALWAWVFDQAKVSYESYPVNQAYGINTDLQHWEFAQKPCPGKGIIDQTEELQDRVRKILEKFQLAQDFPKVKSFPKPDGFDHTNFKACVRKVKVRRGGGAELFQFASNDAPATGKPLPKGSIVPVIYVIKNEDGAWYVHASGHRMKQSHFVERMTWGSSE